MAPVNMHQNQQGRRRQQGGMTDLWKVKKKPCLCALADETKHVADLVSNFPMPMECSM
jgi:hypothetical protein